MYDVIVIGGGPAGLTAALYALRNGKKTIVIEKDVFGGQITNSPKVENIPGFVSISGDEFADKFLEQVQHQGGEIMFEQVTGLTVDPVTKVVTAELSDGEKIEGLTAILATGTKHRTFGFEGEDDLIGNGLHFCAVCDGDFYKDKTVVMFGGGNSAFVEGVLLADLVKKLIFLQDLPVFTADAKLQSQLFSHDNIETHVNTKVLGYIAEDGRLSGVRYTEIGEDGQPSEEKTVNCDGAFIAIGQIPDNEPFRNVANLDKWGYFESTEQCITNEPNIFVAGDCRSKNLRQVSTASSDGAQAAINACNYLRNV